MSLPIEKYAISNREWLFYLAISGLFLSLMTLTSFAFFSVVFLMLCFLALTKSKSLIPSVALFVCAMNWLIMAIGINYFEWSDFVLIAYLRVICLIFIFYFCCRYFSEFKIKKKKLAAFATGLGFFFAVNINITDFGVVLNYTFNTFLSLLVFYYVLYNLVEKRVNILNLSSFNISLWIFVTACILFVAISVFGFDEQEFFYQVGFALRGEGTDGNYETHIHDVYLKRFPGIFADPILSSTFFSSLFVVACVFFRNYLLKIVTCLVCLVFLVLSLSKAGFLYIVLFSVFYTIMLVKLRKGLKLFILLFTCFVILLTLMLRAVFGAGQLDSSYVHTMGFITPFIADRDIAYFIGHGLSNAGNLGGWLAEGAESFVGMLMYSYGLLGVFLYIAISIRFVWLNIRKSDRLNRFLVAMFLPIFCISFLQENIFNSSFIIIRLFFVIYAYSLYMAISTKRNSNSSC